MFKLLERRTPSERYNLRQRIKVRECNKLAERNALEKIIGFSKPVHTVDNDTSFTCLDSVIDVVSVVE